MPGFATFSVLLVGEPRVLHSSVRDSTPCPQVESQKTALASRALGYIFIVTYDIP